MHGTKKRLGLVIGAVWLVALSLLGSLAPSANADVRNGEKLVNSSSSDGAIYIYPDGKFTGSRRITLSPGQSWTANAGDFSPANLKVEIPYPQRSFRIRYDATSGAYQACQNIGSGGKIFNPASKGRIDFLNYFKSDCVHG